MTLRIKIFFKHKEEQSEHVVRCKFDTCFAIDKWKKQSGAKMFKRYCVTTSMIYASDSTEHISYQCVVSTVRAGWCSSPVWLLRSHLHYCFTSVFLPKRGPQTRHQELFDPTCLALELVRGGSAVITQCDSAFNPDDPLKSF